MLTNIAVSSRGRTTTDLTCSLSRFSSSWVSRSRSPLSSASSARSCSDRLPSALSWPCSCSARLSAAASWSCSCPSRSCSAAAASAASRSRSDNRESTAARSWGRSRNARSGDRSAQVSASHHPACTPALACAAPPCPSCITTATHHLPIFERASPPPPSSPSPSSEEPAEPGD